MKLNKNFVIALEEYLDLYIVFLLLNYNNLMGTMACGRVMGNKEINKCRPDMIVHYCMQLVSVHYFFYRSTMVPS